MLSESGGTFAISWWKPSGLIFENLDFLIDFSIKWSNFEIFKNPVQIFVCNVYLIIFCQFYQFGVNMCRAVKMILKIAEWIKGKLRFPFSPPAAASPPLGGLHLTSFGKSFPRYSPWVRHFNDFFIHSSFLIFASFQKLGILFEVRSFPWFQ